MAVLRTLHRLMLGGLVGGALLVCGAAPTWGGTVRVGDALPAVTFSDWQSGSVRLVAPSAGVLIIDFWASWCQPCRAALPELNAIAQRYAADDLQVVAVNLDKAQPSAEAFIKTYVPTAAMTLLRDPGGVGLATYGASGIPALYVVDHRGIVRLVESGFTVEKLREVEGLVSKLLSRGDSP